MGAGVGGTGARGSASVGHGNTGGRMSGSGTALPPISSLSPRGVGEEQTSVDALGREEIPEPERSLMPKKELLRKKQQALLRKTDVTFYRKQMNSHFKKILEAVELTYTDASAKKSQTSLNLAKPTLERESRHFASVGV